MKAKQSRLRGTTWSFQRDRDTTEIAASGCPVRLHKDGTSSNSAKPYVVVGIKRGVGFEINIDLSVDDGERILAELTAAIAKAKAGGECIHLNCQRCGRAEIAAALTVPEAK